MNDADKIAEARDWPERLMLRDTGLHDDLGGPGQRIYTTAGRGYERVAYVRSDISDAQAQQIEAQAIELSRAKSRGDNHWETLKGIRHIAKTSGDLDRIILWVDDAGSGYMDRPEASLAEVCDERNAARAEADALARRIAELEAALRLHKAWADSEATGPHYGGQTRDTHPDGERIWRQWWDGNLDLCDRAQAATDAALGDTP